VGALEWSGPHPRGCSALERGGLCSRGGLSPRARRTPPEGAWKPRAGRTPPEGASIPRARRTSLEGRPLRGTGGPRGPPGSWLCRVCVLGVRVDLCFAFFAGFKQVSPLSFRGPLGLSPTVAPEHLWVFPLGSRRCWSLLIGRSSLLVANAFPWGRVSGPAGLAPEALQERECSRRGFFASYYQCAGHSFQPASAMFQPASVTHARLVVFAFGAPQEV
jgi:hypothetical protein